MDSIEIRVYGTPAPQGSKSFRGMSKKGHAILSESSKSVKPWRQDVVAAAVGMNLISGPVELDIIFTLQKPKSAPKTKRTWPDRKPDIDKCVRSTADALVTAGVIEDDARVVRLLASKVFPGESPDSLHVPGAVIRIRSLSESRQQAIGGVL